VKRGIVDLMEEAAEFNVSGLKRRGPAHLDFIFNPEQKAALEAIQKSVEEGKFSVSLLHGVTGSGKTAVYLAAMQAVLESGSSASPGRQPPTSIKCSATRSRSSIPRSRATSALNNGIASGAETLASLSARAPRSLRLYPIWR